MTKRKNFTLVAFLLMAAFTVHAQFSVGIRGGVNWANIQATEALDNITPDFKNLDEWNLALVAEYAISDNFAFQPELEFVKKGFRIKENFGVELFNTPLPLGVNVESRFRYVNMPLLAKVKFGDNVVKGYALAGPTFGYALNGNLITKANVIIDIKLLDEKIDLQDIDYQRLEVGGMLGAGLSFDTNAGQFFIDARYNHGFTELYDIPYAEEKVKNKGFGINVGFMMPIGQ